MNKPQSETPRTDARQHAWYIKPGELCAQDVHDAYDFARTLDRELTAEREARAKADESRDSFIRQLATAERERDEYRAGFSEAARTRDLALSKVAGKQLDESDFAKLNTEAATLRVKLASMELERDEILGERQQAERIIANLEEHRKVDRLWVSESQTWKTIANDLKNQLATLQATREQDHGAAIEVADKLAKDLGAWFNERERKGYAVRDEWESLLDVP